MKGILQAIIETRIKNKEVQTCARLASVKARQTDVSQARIA
jgi:hypothetical protein